MFVNAIKEVAKFTRPIQTITRRFGSNDITPGLSTLFFVNDEGVAVTCKHVAQLIIAANGVNQKFEQFKKEAAKLPKDNAYDANLKALANKYGYDKNPTLQIKNSFLETVEGMNEMTVHQHPVHDLAIVHFKGHSNTRYKSHATFLKDHSKIEQGKSLCRLGYPFPEYNNFKYDRANDDIVFDQSKTATVPVFPIDGIITRNIVENGELMGIEMSTPGLKGQSGGPLFDKNGIIYGMQQSTKHLHLGFDIENKEIVAGGQKKRINDYAFLHLGQCIRVDVIKAFLDEHGVGYSEG